MGEDVERLAQSEGEFPGDLSGADDAGRAAGSDVKVARDSAAEALRASGSDSQALRDEGIPMTSGFRRAEGDGSDAVERYRRAGNEQLRQFQAHERAISFRFRRQAQSIARMALRRSRLTN